MTHAERMDAAVARVRRALALAERRCGIDRDAASLIRGEILAFVELMEGMVRANAVPRFADDDDIPDYEGGEI